MSEHKQLLSKWLRILFYAHIGSLVIGIINTVSSLGGITPWVSRLLTVVTILSIMQLKNVSPRYRKAAVFHTVVLLCGLIIASRTTAGTAASTIVILVSSGCSLVASYQEYHGHGEVIGEADRKLAGSWNALFGWEILVSAAFSLVSGGAAILLGSTGMDSKKISSLIVVLSNASSFLLQGLYLLYMSRTLKLIENSEDIVYG